MKKYQIIYADPPWIFNDTGKRWVGNEYNLMETKDICKLPIKNLSDEDCMLFIWATYPKLKDVFEVIDAWGFIYKTVGFTWIKKNKNGIGIFTGMGFWTRSNAEICLIATKGRPKKINSDALVGCNKISTTKSFRSTTAGLLFLSSHIIT